MRLVFIHGRAQGKRDDADIEREWVTGLTTGLHAAGREPISAEVISLPFYGATLDRLTDANSIGMFEIIFRGEADDSAQLDEFGVEFLHEVAGRAGVTDEEIEAEMAADVVARAPWNWEWVQATGRALDRRVPWLANAAMYAVTKDVRIYLSRSDVRNEINAIVEPALVDEPCIVVAHSLGSIVAYWLLDELGNDVSVPLLVTAGSPLGIKAVKKRLKRPLGMPDGVSEWLNASDPRDPVALHAELRGDTFPAPITNIGDISNPEDDAHSITGYLSDPRVAESIAAALAL